MANNVEEHAKNAILGAKDKAVLDYILDNRREACLLTSNIIAGKLGVSVSRVVRLSMKLGYENFSDFKHALQEEVVSALPGKSAQLPLNKIKQYEKLGDEEILAAYSANLDENLSESHTVENDAKIIAAAGMIAAAKHVYIVGSRTCAGFASSAGIMLSSIRPHVTAINGGGPIIDSLVDVTKDDVMIAISFARYSSSTAFAVRMASDSGCRVIAMTDSFAAPFAKSAELVITSSSGNMSFFDSYVSFLANIEKILILVSKRGRLRNEARLLKMEKYLKITGQY